MKYKRIIINILIIIGFMLIASSNIFIQQLSNLDEMWIYNFGRNIINGLLPYKDFNIIITPLFAYISAGFLKIFDDEMIVLRFAEAFQTALILFMCFKILSKLEINKGISLLFALGIYFLYSKSFCFDYNWAVLLVLLIILYIELQNKEKLEFNFKKDLFIGILAGISILLKQTSGIALSIVVIVYRILEIRSTKDLKQLRGIALTRLLGVLIPILFFAIYLSVNNIWTEFIDYTILGLKTFSNKIPYTRLLENGYILGYVMPVLLAIIIIVSAITLVLRKTQNQEYIKKLHTLMAFDIAEVVVIYPISDIMHFAVGTICILLTVLYLLHIWFVYVLDIKNEKVKKYSNNLFDYLAITFFTMLTAVSTMTTIRYFEGTQNEKYLNHFKYIKTRENLYEVVKELDEYIQDNDKDIIILDSMASVINIPINKYYKNYDMFNLGNFGKKGEDGIIEDLKYRNNTLILLKKEVYGNNWQQPNKVINYVRETFSVEGEIGVFNIYTK